MIRFTMQTDAKAGQVVEIDPSTGMLRAVPKSTVPNSLAALTRRDSRRSNDGTCYGFEDALDGFVVHGEKCPNVGKSWLSGSDCIQYSTWRGAWPLWVNL